MITILILVLSCLYVFRRWVQRRDEGKPKPPMLPGAVPVLGHAHLCLNQDKLYDFIMHVSEFCLENNGVIRLQLGPMENYVIADPDDCFTLANSCLRKNYAYDYFKDWVGAGILFVNPEEWKLSRKLLMPAFSFTVLNQYNDIFNDESRRLVQTLIPLIVKGPIDIEKYIIRHILEITYHTTLQLNSNNEEDKETFINTSTELMDCIVYRLQRIWLAVKLLYKLTPNYWRFRELIRVNKCVSKKIIEERKAELQKHNDDNLETAYDFDKFRPLLDLLLKLSEQGKGFKETELTEHISTFIVASYDTTVTVMTAFLVLVGTHKRVQEKLFNELQNHFGDSKRDVVKEDLYELPYLDAVVKESLRLYPAALFVTRVTDKDVQLKNYTIASGTNFGMLLSAINRHPSWGADANKFRPERWLEPGGIPDNPNAFAAFSLGKRDCIGKRYALMVMKITFIHLLREFKISSNINAAKFYLNPLLKFKSGQELKLDLR